MEKSSLEYLFGIRKVEKVKSWKQIGLAVVLGFQPNTLFLHFFSRTQKKSLLGLKVPPKL